MNRSAKQILTEFKKFDKPLIINDQGLSFNRYTLKNDIELSIDYFKKNDLGTELLSIKLIDKNLKHLIDAKDKLENFSNQLCKRITYLSESFKLIEVDKENKKAQIRSYPPYIKYNEKLYFEIIIDATKSSLYLSRKATDVILRKTKPVSFILPDDLLERVLHDLTDRN